MVTPAARREAVAHLEETLEVSERRACSIIAADRSVVRYLSRRPDDTALRARLRELADQRRRFGYRRLHVLLRSEGWTMNRKKTQRLYGEVGLAVRRRRSRRRVAVARTPIPKPDGPNSRWSTDFVHDQLANGRRFRVLTIIDDVTKECLAAVPDTSLSGKRVVREMDALITRRGRPGAIVSDNGAEFTSSAVLAGCLRRDPETATGIGAAPPRKLRTDACCYRRAHAQFSTLDSSDPWMNTGGHLKGRARRRRTVPSFHLNLSPPNAHRRQSRKGRATHRAHSPLDCAQAPFTATQCFLS